MFTILSTLWYKSTLDRFIESEKDKLSMFYMDTPKITFEKDKARLKKTWFVGSWDGTEDGFRTTIEKLSHDIVWKKLPWDNYTVNHLCINYGNDVLQRSLHHYNLRDVSKNKAVVVTTRDHVIAILYNGLMYEERRENCLYCTLESEDQFMLSEFSRIESLEIRLEMYASYLRDQDKIREVHPIDHIRFPWYAEVSALVYFAHTLGVFSLLKNRLFGRK